MGNVVTSLPEAIGVNVRAGDAVHVVTNHSRWTAAARELTRQWWGRDPGFTLVMLSLSSLGTVLFRGQLLRRVVTGYSGDVFPNFTPNRWFGDAYLSGEVEVEHWSFLTFLQRLEAAARGLPAVTTRSLRGSSMEDNAGFALVDSPFAAGRQEPQDDPFERADAKIGLLAPYAPDVALLHAPMADRDGNVALSPPLLEGIWGALAARRGAVVTVERVVDDIRPWSHLVKIPAHRVLAVVETPMGAHPGGLYAPYFDKAIEPYGEDLEFWAETAAASRSADFDAWVQRWILEPADQEAYLARLGANRQARLRRRADPRSWRDDEAAHPPDLEAPIGAWETAAVYGARLVARRVAEGPFDAVLAGAGVANLAAWLALRLVRQEHGEKGGAEDADTSRRGGAPVVLTAELGLWGYQPTPADPFVFNHRSFPSATMVADTDSVLGTLCPGPGTRLLGCLGAAQIDRRGNVNSTVIPGRAFLVGSGGGNDVASTADEVVVVATLTARRTVDEVGYVTSPGDRMRAFVSDLGVFERRDGELVLVAVPVDSPDAAAGARDPAAVDRAVARVRQLCPWDLRVAATVGTLAPPTADEVGILRRWDPERHFLRPD